MRESGRRPFALLGKLVRRPGQLDLAVAEAFAAERRGDLHGAAERWQALCRRAPQFALAFAGFGGVLRKLGRLDAARAVLDDAAARLPENLQLMLEGGWLALDRNDLDDALARWQDVRRRYPDVPEGYVGLGSALRQMLRFADADGVLREGLSRFPDKCFVATNWATNADVAGQPDEALRRWQHVRDRHPDEAIGYAGLGAALKTLGRFDEADAVLAEGMRRFPADDNLAINHALVADLRGDWPAAMRRWAAAAERFPNNRRVRDGLAETRWHRQLAEADEAAQALMAMPENTGPANSSAGSRELLTLFESLGENCELGFVQRHFGAEPLGLLRWSGIGVSQLIEALDSDFAGVGTAEHTLLEINPANSEYYTQDRRYGMSMHTFVDARAQARDAVFARMCRRLVYLKDKLLDDLRRAEKLFVLNTGAVLSEAEIRRLHRALRRHGPGTLLYVRPYDGAAPGPGDVVALEPGLLIAALDKAGFDGRRWDVSFELWHRICSRAHALADLPAKAAFPDAATAMAGSELRVASEPYD